MITKKLKLNTWQDDHKKTKIEHCIGQSSPDERTGKMITTEEEEAMVSRLYVTKDRTASAGGDAKMEPVKLVYENGKETYVPSKKVGGGPMLLFWPNSAKLPYFVRFC
jgi:hypothetical protein